MPPEKPAQPLSLIRFGSHLVPLPSKPNIGVISLPFVGRKFDFRLDRSRVLRDSSEMHVSSSDAICTADFLEDKVSNSISNPSLGCTGYNHCLDKRHDRSQCANNIRCRACFNYGHVQRICLTKARPRLVWIWKEIPTNRIDCKVLLESRAVDARKPDSLPYQSRDQPNPAHPIPIVAKDHQMEDNGVQAGAADGIQASAADGAHAIANNWAAWNPALAPKVVAQNEPDVPPKDNSSSSDASSPLTDEEALKFMAANKLYADQLFYTNDGLPYGFIRRGIYPLNLAFPNAKSLCSSIVNIIVIDKNIFNAQEAVEVFVPYGMDLVPWKPVVHAVMLQVLAALACLSHLV